MTTNYFDKYDLEDFEQEIFTNLQRVVPTLNHEKLVDLFQVAAETYQLVLVQDGYEAAKLELIRTELLKRLEESQ